MKIFTLVCENMIFVDNAIYMTYLFSKPFSDADKAKAFAKKYIELENDWDDSYTWDSDGLYEYCDCGSLFFTIKSEELE